MSQPAEPVISVEVDITWDDVREFVVFDSFGTGWLRHYRRLFILGFLLLAVVEVVQFFVFTSVGCRLVITIEIAFALLGAAAPRMCWDTWKDIQSNEKASGLVGHRTVTLDAQGVSCRGADFAVFTPWAGVGRAVEYQGAVYLWTSPNVAIILPRSAFKSAEAASRFCADAVRLHRERGETPQAPVASGRVVSPRFALSEHEVAAAEPARQVLALGRADVFWVAGGFLGAHDFFGGALVVQLTVGAVGAAIAWYFLGGMGRLLRFRSAVRTQFELASEGLRDVSLGVDERGLFEASPISRIMDTWQSVENVVSGPDATYFWNRRAGVYVLPRRAFPTDDAYFDFVEKALEFRKQALAA